MNKLFISIYNFILKLPLIGNVLKLIIQKSTIVRYYKSLFILNRDIKNAEGACSYKNYALNKVKSFGTLKIFITFSDNSLFFKQTYSPIVYYDCQNNSWIAEVEGFKLKSYFNPLLELLSELRGYTLVENIGKGDVVVDVGCSDGLVSCFFANKVGENGKVISLEPDSEFLKIMKINIESNCLSNIILIQKALYQTTQKIKYSLNGAGSKISEVGELEVDAIDIQSLLKELEIEESRVKLIKLDIEGGEISVLDSLISFVERNCDTVVCIASYHMLNGEPTYKQIEERCKKSEEVFAKTIYPPHISTFILNSNSQFVEKLRLIPDIDIEN